MFITLWDLENATELVVNTNDISSYHLENSSTFLRTKNCSHYVKETPTEISTILRENYITVRDLRK